MNSSVLILHIAEVFCHGQAGQCHAHTGSRGLVHLAVDQRGLVDNAALGHFAVQVVALAGALTDAGKYRVTVVLGGDVIDQLLDQDGLADTGAAEQADLTALGVGADQVNDLDAGLKDLVGTAAPRSWERDGGWASRHPGWGRACYPQARPAG